MRNPLFSSLKLLNLFQVSIWIVSLSYWIPDDIESTFFSSTWFASEYYPPNRSAHLLWIEGYPPCTSPTFVHIIQSASLIPHIHTKIGIGRWGSDGLGHSQALTVISGSVILFTNRINMRKKLTGAHSAMVMKNEKWTSRKLWETWIFRLIALIVVVFLIGFSIVLPVDSIVQAAESSHDVFNTFIVVGALAAYALLSIIIIIGRILFYRSCFEDIPRYYLPITPNDLPHRGSRKMIIENMEKSKELSILFKRPKDPVIHAGLEPPSRCDDPRYEKLLPDYLNYRDCIKSLSDRLKYQGIFLDNVNVDMKLGETFADVIRNQFIRNNQDETQIENSKKFIELYETIRYSGQEVTRQQFIDFITLTIYFVEISLTRDDRQPDLGRLNTTSQLQFNFDNGTWEKDTSNYSMANDTDPNDVDYYYPENTSQLRRTNSTNTVARRMPSFIITNPEEESTRMVLDPSESMSASQHRPSLQMSTGSLKHVTHR